MQTEVYWPLKLNWALRSIHSLTEENIHSASFSLELWACIKMDWQSDCLYERVKVIHEPVICGRTSLLCQRKRKRWGEVRSKESWEKHKGRMRWWFPPPSTSSIHYSVCLQVKLSVSSWRLPFSSRLYFALLFPSLFLSFLHLLSPLHIPQKRPQGWEMQLQNGKCINT